MVVLVSLGAGGATEVSDGPVTPVFVIDKSLNRNQVVYGLSLDRTCALQGEEPVRVYWQMRERGAHETEGLLDAERPLIGLGPQRVIERRPDGGKVRVAIRALPERPLTFEARRVGEGCEAWATMTIAGRDATLEHVFAQVWLLGVISVSLEGRVEGAPIVEQLR